MNGIVERDGAVARSIRLTLALTVTCLWLGEMAYGHSFSTPYILPIPYWIYVYGCAATLIATFAILGVSSTVPVAPSEAVPASQPEEPGSHRIARPIIWILRSGAAGCLILTIAAGALGNPEPGINIGMSLFWVYFLLGFAYLTILIGNIYPLINPWRLLVNWLERFGQLDLTNTRLPYPRHLGSWPAFCFYVLLIFLELFSQQRSHIVAILLLSYGAVTLLGVYAFGKSAWFRNADFFSVYFDLIGRLAPIQYDERQADGRFHFRIRTPMAGLLNEKPDNLGVLLVILFMLSSTAYDGILETQTWTVFYWKYLLLFVQSVSDIDLNQIQPMLMSAFLLYRKVSLLLSPFLYFMVYLAALFIVKQLTQSHHSLRSLALYFSYSLIPIAVAYNFTHYYTFVYSQIAHLPWLANDPLGLGWQLLGLTADPGELDIRMDLTWHMQVAVILLGHVAGVVVSHQIARRVFQSRRQVVVSQVPLLVLMVAYTVAGLWILTLPLG